MAEIYKNRDSLIAVVRWRLVVGCVLLATVLVIPVLGWLVVPQPGLSVLSLEGCTAAIWRPYTGRTVVIAASTGFGRRHNDGKLLDALRYRGVNRVHHWYWVGGAGEFPQEYEGIQIDQVSPVGGDPGAGEDLAWLMRNGEAVGSVLQLGSNRILYILNESGPEVLGEDGSPGLSADYAIEGKERNVMVCESDRTASTGIWKNFAREFEITASGVRQF